MLFMVIENFRDGNAEPVYRRLRDKGRLTPEGLTFLNSWVAADLSRCFQIMECEEAVLLQKWVAEWSDLIEFEIVAVEFGGEAANALAEKTRC